MVVASALFVSGRDDWPTPWGFFRKLDLEFDFTLDVCAAPWRTDTAWFHENVYPHARIEFLRGRLKFEGAAASAPFPSMIAVWGKA